MYQSIVNVIDGPRDIKEVLMEHQVIKIHQKCQLLVLSLNFALEHMPKWKNWDRCCNEVISIVKKIGYTKVGHGVLSDAKVLTMPKQ